MNLPVSARSKPTLDALVRSMPHAVILHGPSGVGLRHAAQYIATQRKTNLRVLTPDEKKTTIGVETIRDLRDQAVSNRVKIYALDGPLTAQAQNALLKLLEEPNTSTKIFILASNTKDLLPTVTSRAARYEISPLSTQESEDFLSQLGVNDATKRHQMLFLASGLAEELERLATDEDYFTARAARVRDAQELLRANRYDALRITARYQEREDAKSLVSDVLKLLKQNVRNDEAVIAKLVAFNTTYERLDKNVNTRLAIAAAVI